MRRIVLQVLLVACVAAVCADPAAAQRIIYVDDDATCEGNGSSWTEAYRCLQDALMKTDTVSEAVEIRVAQGMYKPDQGAGLQAGDADATFGILNGVTIRGGYAGLGEPDPNACDPSLYETILSGDLQDNDGLFVRESFYDNSRHVVTADATDATAVLEGVTIAHGAYMNRIIPPGAPRGGGGIYNRAGSPTIRRCIFSSNIVPTGFGAAMLNYEGASPHLDRCTFRGNLGRPTLYDEDSATELTDCCFVENYGTTIEEYASQPKLERCSFTDNGDIALYLDEDSDGTVSNSVFSGNHNAISGRSVVCTDCVFTGNTRVNAAGGAVEIQTGTFIRCRFRDNFGGAGGAIYAGSLTLDNCLFIRNSAVSYGAVGCAYADIHGCLFAGNCAMGAAALNVSERGKLSNCTIVGNRSRIAGTVEVCFAETVMTNCIIHNNSCQDTSLGDDIVYGHTTIGFTCVAPPPSQLKELGFVRDGLIDVDPCFVNPGYWDPNGTPEDPNDDFFVEGDYHLKSQAGRWDPNSAGWVIDEVTSPCIDAGDPNSPVGDEPQPNGGRINMGAYGGTAEASKSYFDETAEIDLDGVALADPEQFCVEAN
ncbi:MAG: right-handed parallel beta-helix repeat-containing protein [Sedimentisphaerales bacterium]|nr:right-handed parallel beta-helix repeat-containing protein [Sedimentisphaerales bacterium]